MYITRMTIGQAINTPAKNNGSIDFWGKPEQGGFGSTPDDGVITEIVYRTD